MLGVALGDKLGATLGDVLGDKLGDKGTQLVARSLPELVRMMMLEAGAVFNAGITSRIRL